jgi:PA14 domain
MKFSCFFVLSVTISLAGLACLGQSVALSQQLGNLVAQPANLSIVDLQSQVAQMEEAKSSPDTIARFVASWTDGNGQVLSAAEQSGQDASKLFQDRLWFLLWRLRYESVCGREFSVTWTGTVTAPFTGAYKFSICPVNPCYQSPNDDRYLRQSMRVTIGGKTIIDAKYDDWQSESGPISLTAGQPSAIQVEYVHSRRGADEPVGASAPVNGSASPAALLYWEGPGFTKSLVPQNALTAPDGQTKGLLASYRSAVDGLTASQTRIEPRIDHNWAMGHCVVPLFEPQQNALVEQAWQRFQSGEVTADWLQQQPRWLISDLQWVVECLPQERRLDIVDWGLAHPELMSLRPWWSVEQFYVNLRQDSPTGALNVLGRWMQDHADEAPTLSDDYYKTNQVQYCDMAEFTFHHFPPHSEQLEANFLVTKDGRCVLPAAYALAYGYLADGRIEEWIKKLEERLSDKSLTGDRRVNWLLARAMAEEIRYLRTGRQVFDRPHVGNGASWIDESTLVAESQSAKTRVLKERVVRLAETRQWDAARAELRNAPTELAGWNDQIATLEKLFILVAQQEAIDARAAYRSELEHRRQAALEHGDAAGADRFSAMIGAFENR